jgi:hypothetical protein
MEPLVSRYGLSSLLITHTQMYLYIQNAVRQKILDSISSCSKPSDASKSL